MKRALIAFLVAFGLTIAISALRLIGGVPALSFVLTSYSTASNIIIAIVGIGLFFASFYLLANTTQIAANKATIIALLLGVLLGSAVSVILLWTPSVLVYFSAILWSSLLFGVIQYFMPALIALLLADFNRKKANSHKSES